MPLAVQTYAVAVPYELSAGYVSGFVAALKQLNWIEELLPALPPADRDALEHPNARTWWEPGPIEHAGTQLLLTRGAEAVAALGDCIVVPAVSSFFKIVMTLGGGAPEAVLKNFSSLARASIRGVDITSTAVGPRRMKVTIRYPLPSPRSNGLLWKGAIRHIMKVTRTEAHVRMDHRDGTFDFDVEWR